MNNRMQHALPGPVVGTILTQQETHRSTAVLESPDEHFQMRSHRSEGWHRNVDMSDPRVCNLLLVAGFYGVSRLRYIQFDSQLLIALLERWRPETHTFHLYVGEATITLQDVEVLLGMPVDGLPIIDDGVLISTTQMCALVFDLLGFMPSKVHGRQLLMGDIEGYLVSHPLQDDTSVEDVQRYTRCVIMLLIGSFFANKSGNRVSVSYLHFIRDFGVAGAYSWGSGLLAVTYRGLCDGCRIGSKSLGGCSLLVQLWAWTRLIHIAPQIVGRRTPHLGDRLGLPPGPFGRIWTDARFCRGDAPAHSLRHYRDQLDIQHYAQVCDISFLLY